MLKSNNKLVDKIINLALQEDIGSGDITSKLLIDQNAKATFFFITREDIIFCGAVIVQQVFNTVDKNIKVKALLKEGQKAKKGQKIIEVTGPARNILTAERTALNFLQRMCGVATNTRKYLAKIAGTKATLLDTRKTIPGHRTLDKYAVKIGGGTNHRLGLYDAIMIKDNHLAIFGSLEKAIRKVKKSKLKIQVECDSLAQVKQAVEAGADSILLDNMNIAELKKAVIFVNGKIPLEASGGVNLKTIRKIAETGVDFISVGALTHSAPNADIGLDMVL